MAKTHEDTLNDISQRIGISYRVNEVANYSSQIADILADVNALPYTQPTSRLTTQMTNGARVTGLPDQPFSGELSNHLSDNNLRGMQMLASQTSPLYLNTVEDYNALTRANQCATRNTKDTTWLKQQYQNILENTKDFYNDPNNANAFDHTSQKLQDKKKVLSDNFQNLPDNVPLNELTEQQVAQIKEVDTIVRAFNETAALILKDDRLRENLSNQMSPLDGTAVTKASHEELTKKTVERLQERNLHHVQTHIEQGNTKEIRKLMDTCENTMNAKRAFNALLDDIQKVPESERKELLSDVLKPVDNLMKQVEERTTTVKAVKELDRTLHNAGVQEKDIKQLTQLVPDTKTAEALTAEVRKHPEQAQQFVNSQITDLPLKQKAEAMMQNAINDSGKTLSNSAKEALTKQFSEQMVNTFRDKPQALNHMETTLQKEVTELLQGNTVIGSPGKNGVSHRVDGYKNAMNDFLQTTGRIAETVQDEIGKGNITLTANKIDTNVTQSQTQTTNKNLDSTPDQTQTTAAKAPVTNNHNSHDKHQQAHLGAQFGLSRNAIDDLEKEVHKLAKTNAKPEASNRADSKPPKAASQTQGQGRGGIS